MPGAETSKRKEIEGLEKLVRENETALNRIRKMVDKLKGELEGGRAVNGKAKKSGFDSESAQRNGRVSRSGSVF